MPSDSALHQQLETLQLSQLANGRRAIILLEGPPGAGKKQALRALGGIFDPCHFNVHCTEFDRRQAAEGHWLARFWRQLPSAGRTAIFFRSWYRRVLEERISGRLDDGLVARAFDEINEFEAQQRDYGTILAKLYFDVSPEVQARRLAEHGADGWEALIRREEPLLVSGDDYRRALADLRKQSNTRWSPWTFIDGDNPEHACRDALVAVAAAWSEAVPLDPPHIAEGSTRAA